MPRRIDDYAYRRFEDLPNNPHAGLQKQILFRLAVNEVAEQAEAYEFLQGLKRGDMAEVITRALLLYKDYWVSMKDLPDAKLLREWTMEDLLQAAVEEEDEADAAN